MHLVPQPKHKTLDTLLYSPGCLVAVSHLTVAPQHCQRVHRPASISLGQFKTQNVFLSHHPKLETIYNILWDVVAHILVAVPWESAAVNTNCSLFYGSC